MLPLLGVRVLYSCISSFDPKINAFQGPIVYRVVLAVLMEIVISIVFIFFGWQTRDIGRCDLKLEKEIQEYPEV